MMMHFEPAAFLCDELDVRPAGRAPLPERCSGPVYHIFNLLRLSRPEMTSIAVCGGLTDGENGFLIDNDVKSFEEKLRELIADPQRVHRVGEQASRSIVRSWEDVVGEVLDRYNALIASRTLIARP